MASLYYNKIDVGHNLQWYDCGYVINNAATAKPNIFEKNYHKSSDSVEAVNNRLVHNVQ